MSLRDFQAALSHLYLKPSFRRRFTLHPDRTLKTFRLKPPEARALKALDRARLEAFCEGLELKNSARLEACFRGTARLVKGRFRSWYREYSDRHSDIREWPEKLEAFAVLLFHQLKREGFPPHATELARFEFHKAMLGHWCGRGVRPSLLKGLGLRRYRGRVAPDGARRRRLHAGFMAGYGYDVLALAEGRIRVLFYKPTRYSPLKAVRLRGDGG